MVSSQSLMRWLSSVSWTNFWEVAMKSSYGMTRGGFYFACRALGCPTQLPPSDPSLPHSFEPVPHSSEILVWSLHLGRANHELLS
jgi:hypothetical protein